MTYCSLKMGYYQFSKYDAQLAKTSFRLRVARHSFKSNWIQKWQNQKFFEKHVSFTLSDNFGSDWKEDLDWEFEGELENSSSIRFVYLRRCPFPRYVCRSSRYRSRSREQVNFQSLTISSPVVLFPDVPDLCNTLIERPRWLGFGDFAPTDRRWRSSI